MSKERLALPEINRCFSRFSLRCSPSGSLFARAAGAGQKNGTGVITRGGRGRQLLDFSHRGFDGMFYTYLRRFVLWKQTNGAASFRTGFH